jgi:hypothetical protein
MSTSLDTFETPNGNALVGDRPVIVAEGARQQRIPDVVSDVSDQTNVTRRHILTVGLEDWFQVGSFRNLIESNQWYRFETRIEQSTQATLDLLDQFNAKATFFVLGWIAEQMPELIRNIADKGHEIASRGYVHQKASKLTREEFQEDVLKTREILERATGRSVLARIIHEFGI